MSGHHDPILVALSVLIACAASYVALDVANRVAASDGRARAQWLVAGAAAMGTGIWSMHFVGMLAFTLPVPIGYDVALVTLSAAVAIVASMFALAVAARDHLGRSAAIIGGLLMGAAIAAMHYIGMAAMRAAVTVTYRTSLVALSILIAISASVASLFLAHRYRTVESARGELGKLASALVMGCAIAGMHYTAMAAAQFTPTRDVVSHGSGVLLAGSTLTAAVSLGTLLVLAVALIAATIHRRVSQQLLEVSLAKEAATREQELFLRQVIDASPNLIFVTDQDGRFTLVNVALANALNTTPRELIGTIDTAFSSGANQLTVDDTALESVSQGHAATQAVNEVLLDAGEGRTPRSFDTILLPLHRNGATTVRRLGVATETTTQKQLAEQLRQAQKMEAIGQLTGGIAHDLNNIFTVILANVELLEEQLPASIGDLRQDVRDLQGAATRGAAMVRKLLAFSRRELLVLRPVRLERLASGLAGTLHRLLPATIQVTLRTDPDLAAVNADAGAVEQMLLNLATNSRDAMPDGGLLIISVTQALLDEEWCETHGWGEPGSYVVVAVTDTGSGIEPQVRERIFEPFFTTKPQGAGTGLGLSMVYGLMRQHNGYVEIYSEPGQGSTVNLYFPSSGTDARGATPKSVAAVQGGSETILIADDEEPIRRSAKRVLERHGYTVQTAADGAEALRMLEESGHEIDLIISDVVMPRMGGRELHDALRARGTRVPFLYTSGYAAREVWESVALAAEAPFLHKPWAMSDLLFKVRDILDQRM